MAVFNGGKHSSRIKSVIVSLFQRLAQQLNVFKKIVKSMTEEKNTAENLENEASQTEEVTLENETTEQVEEKSKEEILAAELAEFKDKYLRLYSEFDNFRKRTIKEKSEYLQTANKDMILEIIPILDDFERAIASNEKADDIAVVKEGFKLLFDKFSKTLERKGVTVMEAHGTDFDTEMHEAITQIPAPSEDLKGKVVDVIEKGYHLGEKVIRYAKVVIGA